MRCFVQPHHHRHKRCICALVATWHGRSCIGMRSYGASSLAMMPVPDCAPRSLIVQAVGQSMQCCAVLTDDLCAGHDATARQL